ncbi:PilW family protein, partial [Saccharospirillum sp.]
MTLQRGFSVVELMIAMALSLLLGLGIFQVFTSNQESARLTQALVEVQDTG